MPHYADGTIATPGDKVRGTTYNQPKEIEGAIHKITSDHDACNCIVVWGEAVDPDAPYQGEGWAPAGQGWDYTAVKDLTLV